MKSITILSVLWAGAIVHAAVIPPNSTNIDWPYVQKRQILGTLTWLLGTCLQRSLSNMHS
jgi:hypothetical protein